MSGFASLFEPEELIGSIWHRMVGEAGNAPHFPDEAAELGNTRRRLEIFYRGLGGKPGVLIKAIAPEEAGFRKTLLGKLGHASTAVPRARLDGDHLFLPEAIDVLPDSELNARLYQWLAAWAATAGDRGPEDMDDPLQRDISFVRFAMAVANEVLSTFPGLRQTHEQLRSALLVHRVEKKLPEYEAALEAVIRHYLGDALPDGLAAEIWDIVRSDDISLDAFSAPAGYRNFVPLILWGEIEPAKVASGEARREETQEAGSGGESEEQRSRKAKRNKSDQIERKDSLILARFESILSWAEMMNINRAVDDEDEETARKAADDMEELGLADISRKAATKLKFDLDLAPEDVTHERLAAKHVYPEWDYRKNGYLPDHARILAAAAPELEAGETWQPDREARKRIRAVKRQFEALRPKRQTIHRQIEGNEIDIDALVRSRCDFTANGEGSQRVFSTTRETMRDLAVSVLFDTSRSAESWIDGRQVIDISREALLALATGLAAVGDDNAIYSFSSLRRDRVSVLTIKDFDEPLNPRVFSRIGALKPGFYTRLGAAIRHVSSELCKRGNTRRLLLVITDGKPNDLDHYEGRYGVEDSMMAVREARQAGNAVFGITIDKKAQSYFPHIFGRNAYSIARHSNALTRALPLMYRHLVN